MAVNLSPIWGAGAQLLDNSGNVLSGGKIYTYAAGTTTQTATYTSNSGITANSNPIVLNSAGRVPYEIWLTDGQNYKFVLKDSNDVLIGTWDNLSGINSNFVNYTNQQEIQTATAGQTVFNLTTMQYLPGTGNLSVFVDGVNQYGPDAQYAYEETDQTTITFTQGLHVGALVKFTSTQIQNAGVTDASQISYTPPFTDSVATNVEDKLAQYISVKDFGAVGDGATDDTLAIQSAFDAISGTNKRLRIDSGTYLITDTLQLSHPYYIYGDGLDVSVLKFDSMGGYAGNNGIEVTLTGSTNSSGYMSDMTCVIAGGNGNSCIYTPRDDASAVQQPRYIFERMFFRGDTVAGSNRYDEAWNACLNIGDSLHPVIRDCFFMGNFNPAATDNQDSKADCQTSAIYMCATAIGVNGATVNGAVHSNMIDHCYVDYYGNAVRFVDRVNQGVTTGCHFNGCWNGIYSEASPTATSPYSGTEYFVSDVQINAQRHGIYWTQGWLDINGCRSSRTDGGSNIEAWYGYRFFEAGYVKVNNFRAYCATNTISVNTYGMYFEDSDNAKISNGTFLGLDSSTFIYGLTLNDSLRLQASNLQFTAVATAITFTTNGTTNYDHVSEFSNILYDASVINQTNYNPYVSNRYVIIYSNSVNSYTPTLYNTTNVTASTAYTCYYSRVGNVVTVGLTVAVDPTATSADTILGISLPIVSTFSSSTQLAGTAAEVDSGQNNACQLYADTSNNRATLKFYATDGSNRIWRGSFMYEVA